MKDRETMVLGVIPARGGSKGVKGKNVRLVAGRPLIVYAIECALRCPSIDHVIVSTDSREIAEVAEKYGADVPFIRPAGLAEDATPMLPVLQHAIVEAETYYSKTVECLVLTDPTAPLRTVEDVERCLEQLRTGPYDAVITGHTAHRNPYFNMVRPVDHYAELVCTPLREVGCRQDAPAVFDLNTIAWVYSRNALMEERARLPKHTGLCLVPPERALDLDTELDFQFLEFLLTRKSDAR
jgi:CMP-N-acetylneuraminic acid synthetase